MVLASLLSPLYQAIGDIESIRYAQLASSSIIVFDHVVTLDLEVDFIWRSSWSFGKVIFIINRYYALSSVVFNNYSFFSTNLSDSPTFNVPTHELRIICFFVISCRRFFHWQGWTGLIACVIAEIILQMRLYALYSLNKKVLALMVASFTVTSTMSGIIMGRVLGSITATARPLAFLRLEPLSDIVFCAPSNVSSKFFTFWIPMLANECLLCFLALFRGFQTFRSGGTLFRSGRRLVGILIRDSVLYFIVIMSTYLTCLLVWIIGRQTLLEVPIGFSVAMSCVLANRIILNVRAASKKAKKLPAAPYQVTIEEDGSRNTLSDVEMVQLRSLRSQRGPKFGLI